MRKLLGMRGATCFCFIVMAYICIILFPIRVNASDMNDPDLYYDRFNQYYDLYYNTQSKCFEVSEENPHYAVYDGCLYTKDYSTFLCCPSSKTQIQFHPNVKTIGSRSFYLSSEFDEVIIPWGVTTIENHAFYSLMRKIPYVRIILPDTLNFVDNSNNKPGRYGNCIYIYSDNNEPAKESLTGVYSYDGEIKAFIVDSVDYFYGKSDQEPQILSGDLHHTPGSTYCYGLDGQLLKGWHTVKGELYYFGEDGQSYYGIVEIDGHQYYFNDSGGMQTGWIEIGKATYYFDEDGMMQTGWQEIDGKRYYFDKDGVMQIDWLKMAGKWYYFSANGVMQTGWQESKGKQYYLDTDGVMQIDWLEIDGKRYHFDENGAMQTGWLEIDENLYYLQEDGTVVAPGWQDVDGSQYYFDETGAMARNRWEKIDGKWTRFDEDGGVKKGFWISIAAWFRGLWS